MAFIKKNLSIIALVIVILGAGYYFIFMNGGGGSESTVSVTDGPASAAEATFIRLSSQLEPIHFDTSIFSDPRFNALTDIHTGIVPEVGGRSDPFGPIPGLGTGK